MLQLTRRTAWTIAAWTTLGLAAIVFIARGARHDWTTGDTTALVNGLPGISRCLHASRFTSCDTLPGIGGSYVSKFPLIQSLPAYILHELGLSLTNVIGGLTWINVIAVIAFAVALARWSYRHGGVALAVVSMFFLLPGLLVSYTAQSFGEALSAVAFGSLVVVGLRADRVSRLLLPAAAVATVTKEIAAPLVLVFGVAAVLVAGAGRSVIRTAVIHVVAGTAIGLVANAAFNVFRYGTVINHVYLDEGTSPIRGVPINTVGLLISPNGGLLWFWPGAGIAAVVLLVAALRPSVPAGIRIGAALGVIGFGGAVVSCATWWDPYGWYSWGPRLLIPGAAATLTLAIGIIARHDLRRVWLSAVGLALTGIIAFLVLLPTVGEVFAGGGSQSSQVIATWTSRPECHSPQRLSKSLQQSCTTTEAWRLSSMPLLDAVPRSSHAHRYWLTMVLTAATIAIWLGIARKAVTEPVDTDSPERRRGPQHGLQEQPQASTVAG